MSFALSAQHVQKHYGKFQALQDGSLEMQPGEILALLGPNGAGKTTLIKILATLIRKDAGEVKIQGLDLDRDVEAIRHQIGYVGQDTERSAYARLTVMENFNFFGAMRGLGRGRIRSQVENLADYFDFHGQLDKLFVTLSGGQKQTVVIMRALLHNPALVFLDEPTKGLDPLIARRIRAFLKTYAHHQGKSLLLTSHVLSEVDELADRVALIQRGRIPVCGTPQQLKAALGVNDFIELEKAQLSPAALAQIHALPVVRGQMEREAGWISIGVMDAMAGAEAIIQVLRQAGSRTSFRHHTVSLEDAFLFHIGELNERFEA
ncbi:MAG: ABC transporter ATP-binding protein [Anaerolineales bacterium]